MNLDEARVLIDGRWQGNHGIARCARETLSRLTIPEAQLIDRGSPTSLYDPVWLEIEVRRRRASLYYSPGFNPAAVFPRQLLTVHDLIHLSPRRHSLAHEIYYERLVKPAIRRTGTVLTVSQASQQRIQEWLFGSSVRIVNVGIACSDAFVSSGPIPDLQLPFAKDPYLLYVGNFKAHKNVKVALRAIVKIPDAQIVIVTPDAHLAREQVEALGIAGRTLILSNVDDQTLAGIYRGAAALLMPSVEEGFGLPALEALCSGTSVLYWKGCDSVKQFAELYCDPVDSPSDVDEWTAAATCALETPRSVEAGSLRQEFSWDAVAGRVRATINDFL